MSADPVTIDAKKTVREAIEMLNALGARHLPVTSEGRLVGVLSDRDVRQLTVPVSWNQSVIDEDQAGSGLLEEPVTALMSGGPLSVTRGDSIGTVIDLICDHRVGALPVVDEQGHVVGIVSYVDVLQALRPQE
jgi:acetoin utilization protein AcuB